MVVEEMALPGILVDALTARTVDPAVGFKDIGTATLSALLTRVVDEATSSAGGPADLDFVFGALSGIVAIKTTALAGREEEIMVVTALST